MLINKKIPRQVNDYYTKIFNLSQKPIRHRNNMNKYITLTLLLSLIVMFNIHADNYNISFFDTPTEKTVLDSFNLYYSDGVEWNRHIRKGSYQYNQFGDLISESVQDYSESKQKWMNTIRFINKYNDNRNLTSYLTQYWDSTNQNWKDTQQKLYDKIGYDSSHTYQSWSTYHNSWVNTTKYLFSIYNEGRIFRKLSYSWDTITNNWIQTGKDSTSYDLNGNITYSLQQRRNSILNNLVNNFKDTMCFNNNGKLTETHSFIWDKNRNSWINRYFISHNQDTINKAYQLKFNWDKDLNAWDTTEYSYKMYDNQKNIIVQLIKQWNPYDHIWSIYIFDSITYNDNNQIITNQHYFQDYTSNLILKGTKDQYFYDEYGNLVLRFKDNVKTEFFYSVFSPVIIQNYKKEEAIIYPNPANDRLYIKSNDTDIEIKIFNLSGMLIPYHTLKENCIDISNLNKGIYLIVIEGTDHFSRLKFVKN